MATERTHSNYLPDVPACVSPDRSLAISGYRLTFQETERVAFIVEGERQLKALGERIRHLYRFGTITHAEAARILDWLDSISSFELSALSTVHKTQGRSVDTVYIDTATVLKRPSWLSPRDHKRLLYTAITRGRKRVIFYPLAGYTQQAGGAEIIPFPPAAVGTQSEQPLSRAA